MQQLVGTRWTALPHTIDDAYLSKLDALAGGNKRNGVEAYRKLFLYHARGNVKGLVKGLRHLKKNDPRCEKIGRLEHELLIWKLLLQNDCN